MCEEGLAQASLIEERHFEERVGEESFREGLVERGVWLLNEGLSKAFQTRVVERRSKEAAVKERRFEQRALVEESRFEHNLGGSDASSRKVMVKEVTHRFRRRVKRK